jgi:hypothetical protein
MKKPDNTYSKYRYDNSYTPKFKVEGSKTRMYGVDIRSDRDNVRAQLPTVDSNWINNGATWVANHVFRCNQVNKVDQPVVNDKSAKKRIFFKLFKL